MLVREAKDRSVSAWINEMFLAFTWTQAKKFPAQAMEFVMGWGKQGSEKSLPCLSLSATYLCTAQENVHSPPKIILWEFFIFKKRNNFCISKLFSWAIRSSTLLQKGWAALLIHMQERQQKKKKKKENNLHSHNAKIMPHKPGDVSILLSRSQIKSSQLLLSSTVSEPSGIRSNKSTTCFTKGENPSHPP